MYICRNPKEVVPFEKVAEMAQLKSVRDFDQSTIIDKWFRQQILQKFVDARLWTSPFFADWVTNHVIMPNNGTNGHFNPK